jgi:haloacetate dehalogenase
VFEGFDDRVVEGIHARVGGSGPPLLLLHGYPQTHVMWHRVAPRLAERFTVVAADLTGYGGSHRPALSSDHAAYSKRAMAADQVKAMGALGFERFAVVGHDRGGRCGYRMALDHPTRVERLAVLDIVPTVEVYRRADMAMGLGYWHWFFLSQPAPFPERVISADPEAFFAGGSMAGGEEQFGAEAFARYRDAWNEPQAVAAFCEDYRAGATVDYVIDDGDRVAGNRIGCPALALWGSRGALPAWYDVLAVWREWADDLRGREVDATHYLAEDAPDEVAAELESFLAREDERPAG